jgi:hypothetical protein
MIKRMALATIVWLVQSLPAAAAGYEVLPYQNAYGSDETVYRAAVLDNVHGKIYACVGIYKPPPPPTALSLRCTPASPHQSAIAPSANIVSTLPNPTAPALPNQPNSPPWIFWQIDSVTGDLQICLLPTQTGLSPDCVATKLP